MPQYAKQIGRIRLDVNANGFANADYGHGVNIDCPDGWNDTCPILRLTMSVEELRDLRYLIDRALCLAPNPSPIGE